MTVTVTTANCALFFLEKGNYMSKYPDIDIQT